MNPLDVGEKVYIELMNPNPSSSKTKAGPVYRVSFEMTQEHWQMFMDADTPGMILDSVMQRVADCPDIVDDRPPKPDKGPYRDFARWVYQQGVLRMPSVWRALGSEDNHTDWVQTQACAICGQQDYVNGTGYCEEAHVRTSENAGTGYRPPYVSVPMCNRHHHIQHNQGYSALYEEYCEYHGDCKDIRPDLVSDWVHDRLQKKAIEMTEEWCKVRIYDLFEIDTLTWLKPDTLQMFFDMNEIDKQVDAKYLSPGMAAEG